MANIIIYNGIYYYNDQNNFKIIILNFHDLTVNIFPFKLIIK